MIVKVGSIFLILVSIKVIYNIRNLLWTKYYFQKYGEYIKSGGKGWYIRERKQRILEMFEKSGIKDTTMTIVEPLGYGKAQAVRGRVFQNIAILREDVVGHFISSFKEAQSVFKHRIWQALSPFYWIETFFLLPQKTVMYLGFSGDNIPTKIAQILWWLMNLAGIIGSTIFNTEFRVWSHHYLPSWLSNFFGQ